MLSSFQYFLRSTKHSNSEFFRVTCFQSLEIYKIFSLSPVFFSFLTDCPGLGLLLTMVLGMYLVRPFNLETAHFLELFQWFPPFHFLCSFFGEFLSSIYWTSWSSPLIFLPFIFHLPVFLLCRKFPCLYLLTLLLSFSFVL